MSYTPKTWAADTPLLYTDLNHIEEQYQDILDYLAIHDHDDRYYSKASSDSYFWDTSNDGPASGLDADTLGGSEASAIVGGTDVGLGGYWYGTLSDFSDGYLTADPKWHICNGEDDTINLQDVFIQGAGGYLAVGSAGGNASFTPVGTITVEDHILTVAETMHVHDVSDSYASGQQTSGSITRPVWYPPENLHTHEMTTGLAGGGEGHDHPATFAGGSSSLMSPFRTLIPIQKIA